jgi:hypothetical protein
MGSRSLPAVFDGLHCKTGRTANDVDYEFDADADADAEDIIIRQVLFATSVMRLRLAQSFQQCVQLTPDMPLE